jgi:RecQ-mediated genome instability protein 1
MATTEMAASIRQFLVSKGVAPTDKWLQSFVQSAKPSIPVAAQQKTALFRILTTDIRESVQSKSNGILPGDVSDPETRERQVGGPILVQVLDVEDIGHSRWSQHEAIEAQEKGEMTKGREIIRIVPETETSDPGAVARPSEMSLGPHKLLLQDVKGTTAYGVVLDSVTGIGTQMSIGSKLLLSNVAIARGVMLLESRNIELLGGKVDAWDKKYREERKAVLKQKAEAGNVS